MFFLDFSYLNTFRFTCKDSLKKIVELMRNMEYKVDDQKKKTNLEIKSKMEIKEFLEKIGENRESVIVKVNGKVKTEFDSISEGDEIELIKITSGG